MLARSGAPASAGRMMQNPAVLARKLAYAFTLTALSLTTSRGARADVATCVEAHASGQRAAKAGELKLASQLFASCGAGEDCPSPIREECVQLYADVERNIPTVIFTAGEVSGTDVTAVRVYMDDQLLLESLDGRAIALDPGKHRFKFVLPSGATETTELLVREGEKNRLVAVQPQPAARPTSSTSQAAAEPGAPGASLTPEQLHLSDGKPSLAFWISAGVGAAALGVWGTFAVIGHQHQAKLEDCAPACSLSRHSEFDSMRRDYLIADVSLGVAIAATGVAAGLFLARPTASDYRTTASVRRTPRVLPVLSTRGAGVVVRTSAF